MSHLCRGPTCFASWHSFSWSWNCRMKLTKYLRGKWIASIIPPVQGVKTKCCLDLLRKHYSSIVKSGTKNVFYDSREEFLWPIIISTRYQTTNVGLRVFIAPPAKASCHCWRFAFFGTTFKRQDSISVPLVHNTFTLIVHNPLKPSKHSHVDHLGCWHLRVSCVCVCLWSV